LRDCEFRDCEFRDWGIGCYPEADSLYIDLSEKPSVEGKKISEGVVLDYYAEGNLVGIEIDSVPAFDIVGHGVRSCFFIRVCKKQGRR